MVYHDMFTTLFNLREIPQAHATHTGGQRAVHSNNEVSSSPQRERDRAWGLTPMLSLMSRKDAAQIDLMVHLVSWSSIFTTNFFHLCRRAKLTDFSFSIRFSPSTPLFPCAQEEKWSLGFSCPITMGNLGAQARISEIKASLRRRDLSEAYYRGFTNKRIHDSEKVRQMKLSYFMFVPLRLPGK